ncbi:MAG TPA: hypothetical protein VF236_06635 [Gaiellaceae bacterium]
MRKRARFELCILGATLAVFAAAAVAASGATEAGSAGERAPVFTDAKAFDVSAPLRELAKKAKPQKEHKMRPELGPQVVADRGHSRDGAVQDAVGSLSIGGPLANFEGLSNTDNFNVFGFRVNPPDPVGDVGPNHYVEMINLVFGVYDKSGNKLLGPVDTGSLWADFPIEDCTDPSGDPIVLYDQTTDRWILSQFTTRGLDPATPTAPFYNCVAISKTGDPTGAYFRYAFITQADPDGGFFFPDYPKYGVWSNSYIMTTRDFGLVDAYGISVYALEKNKMIAGNPNARAVQFFLDSEEVDLNLIGDGLLPPDLDGNRRPTPTGSPAPIVGTQDDDATYGATFDALNIWELSVHWRANPTASIELAAQLPVAEFDSIFPCAVVPSTTPGMPANARDCLPQPGITDGSRFLDILSYRQRPTWRLAYRNFGKYEAMVTNQSVEALPGVAGARWYELRRTNGVYSVHQQGTYAPNDGVHRWMGSAAMDKRGNIALGYSVVNGIDVFPGIRYTGRLSGDPAGQMTLGEASIIEGSGVQTTTNSRWGDYTSMNIDPTDDCTFWYVNEYYTAAGQASSPAGWQTRIASFKLPGC